MTMLWLCFLLRVMAQIDETALIKERTYQILVPRVPVTFSLEEDSSLRELEEINYLRSNAIKKARWIKLIYRRAA